MGGVEDAEVIAEIRLFVKEDGEVVVVDGGGVLGLRKCKETNVLIVVVEVSLNQNGNALLDGCCGLEVTEWNERN